MTIESKKHNFTLIVKIAELILLLLTIPIKIYLQVQEQRHSMHWNPTLCNLHTNKSSFTTTTKSWTNQSAPRLSETLHSDFGSAPFNRYELV
jgi:hypothetical protein